MKERPTVRRGTRCRTAGGLAAVGLLAVGGVAVWTGCSVTRSNYKVLSFLFDGVPDPNLPPGAVARSESGKPIFVVLHAPYAQENCEACHRSQYRPTKEDSSICLECHAPVKSQHAYLHGPVAADACLWCHNPHESAHPALLRQADRTLCMQCHVATSLSEREPAHADEARGCLECHSGHGGSTPRMLKAVTSDAAAVRRPATGGK